MEDETAKDENENRYLKKQRDLVFFFSKIWSTFFNCPRHCPAIQPFLKLKERYIFNMTLCTVLTCC